MRNFVDEYAAGRTPIPCVHCNADLKFAHLVERAAGLDAAAVATGPLRARGVRRGPPRATACCAAPIATRTSRISCSRLTQDQLARAMFPVGHLTKTEVRAHAARLGLPVADKPDSHEICFVPDGDAGGLRRAAAGRPRDATARSSTAAARSLGRHRGLHRYTVGQRKGLGLATGTPMYVLRLEPADGRRRRRRRARSSGGRRSRRPASTGSPARRPTARSASRCASAIVTPTRRPR